MHTNHQEEILFEFWNLQVPGKERRVNYKERALSEQIKDALELVYLNYNQIHVNQPDNYKATQMHILTLKDKQHRLSIYPVPCAISAIPIRHISLLLECHLNSSFFNTHRSSVSFHRRCGRIRPLPTVQVSMRPDAPIRRVSAQPIASGSKPAKIPKFQAKTMPRHH